MEYYTICYYIYVIIASIEHVARIQALIVFIPHQIALYEVSCKKIIWWLRLNACSAAAPIKKSSYRLQLKITEESQLIFASLHHNYAVLNCRDILFLVSLHCLHRVPTIVLRDALRGRRQLFDAERLYLSWESASPRDDESAGGLLEMPSWSPCPWYPGLGGTFRWFWLPGIG